jgi:periplasmic protein TonB
MTTKKTKKANLEKKKTIFFQIGLILSLALVFLAFEWKSYDKINEEWSNSIFVNMDEDIVDITIPEKPKPKPKPQTTDLEIVPDDKKDDKTNINIEIDMKDPIFDIKIDEKIKETPDEKEIFRIVEEMPEFIGGMNKMYEYLGNNMTYPQIAKEAGIEGEVNLTFVVEKNGRITDVRILRDIGGGCGEEAIRVVKAMPNWSPGKQRGKAVRVQFNLPVKFTLQV